MNLLSLTAWLVGLGTVAASTAREDLAQLSLQQEQMLAMVQKNVHEIASLKAENEELKELVSYIVADMTFHSEKIEIMEGQQDHRHLTETLEDLIAKTACISDESDSSHFVFEDSCTVKNFYANPPTAAPTKLPSSSPTLSNSPTTAPTGAPSSKPSSAPSIAPSGTPSVQPTTSQSPSEEPSLSQFPSISAVPTAQPTVDPIPESFACSSRSDYCEELETGHYQLSRTGTADESGCVWSDVLLNLEESFVIEANFSFGNKDIYGGAGMAIAIHNHTDSSNTCGDYSQKGYGASSTSSSESLAPIVAVDIDTYTGIESTDSEDIISLTKNKANNVLLDRTYLDNIEDGDYHTVRWVYHAPMTEVVVYFDGEEILRGIVDLVDQLEGATHATWGFTAGTVEKRIAKDDDDDYIDIAANNKVQFIHFENKEGTRSPTNVPSMSPSLSTTPSLSMAPSRSQAPSTAPSNSASPSATPSMLPSYVPTSSNSPSTAPTNSPSTSPSAAPSTSPSGTPSTHPSYFPTSSTSPSAAPSSSPTESSPPTQAPSASPTFIAWEHDYETTEENNAFVFEENAFATDCSDLSQMVGDISNTTYGDDSGGMKIWLISAGDLTPLSAAFAVNFTLPYALQDTHVHFYYRARFQSNFDASDVGKVLVGLDDTHEATVATVSGSTTSTYFAGASANFGRVAAGSHTLKLGAHLAQALPGNSGKAFLSRFDSIVILGSFVDDAE